MKKQHSTKRIVQFLFGLWRVSPVMALSMIFIQIIAVILSNTIAPIFVSQLLTSIANGSAILSKSVPLLVGYGSILIVGEVILFRIVLAFAYLSESKMQAKVDQDILKHLTTKSIGFHSNRMSGGTVSDTTKLVNSVDSFWDNLVFNIVPIVTTVLSVCIALSFIFWQFAIAMATLSIIIIMIIIFVQSKIMPLRKEVAKRSSEKTAYLADVIGNISAVKAFAREKYEVQQYQKNIKHWRSAVVKEMRGVMKSSSIFSVMMAIMNITAFTTAILATEYHLANIGTIYLIISYTLNVVSQLWQVASSTRSYIRVLGDAAPMIDVLDSDIELKDPISPERSNIKKGKIEFKDMTFTHDQTDDALFNNFSLIIKPGERIGLVGCSGSGKTSLTRLLLRFSDIDSGQILIDGQDITKISQAALHGSIAFVPQEPLLFHRSLKDNIAYGKLHATDNEIRDAAKQANALDFIDVLKDGFETLVGERGIKLSGGQRQRIAIARAILKDAPILVLDEATSALDSENERLIQGALAKLMKGRTSIVIAHRLSTIAKLDRIVVLDEGKIIEQGTHSELLENRSGLYAKLWSHQSGGFIEE